MGENEISVHRAKINEYISGGKDPNKMDTEIERNSVFEYVEEHSSEMSEDDKKYAEDMILSWDKEQELQLNKSEHEVSAKLIAGKVNHYGLKIGGIVRYLNPWSWFNLDFYPESEETFGQVNDKIVKENALKICSEYKKQNTFNTRIFTNMYHCACSIWHSSGGREKNNEFLKKLLESSIEAIKSQQCSDGTKKQRDEDIAKLEAYYNDIDMILPQSWWGGVGGGDSKYWKAIDEIVSKYY